MNVRMEPSVEPNPISILAKKWAVEVILTVGDRVLPLKHLAAELNGLTAKSLAKVLRQTQEGSLIRRDYSM